MADFEMTFCINIWSGCAPNSATEKGRASTN
jgi:hypothetical protein